MPRALDARRDERQKLAARLTADGRPDLAEPLERCAQLVNLACTNCGTIQKTRVETRCKRKYCPVCSTQLAAKKSRKVTCAWSHMKWPLFLTLTMPNTLGPEGLKTLSQAFTAFRRRKWWKARNVKGGVACFEVTNKGNGWHPHLHALIDCRWLSSTPEPSRMCSLRENKRRSKEASEQLSLEWSSHLNLSTGAIVWVKRAHDEGVAKEIAKYAVKGNDLLEMKDSPAHIIDVIGNMRMMTTWGSIRPLTPLFEKWEEEQDEDWEGCPCDTCQAKGDLVPENVYEMLLRKYLR